MVAVAVARYNGVLAGALRVRRGFRTEAGGSMMAWIRETPAVDSPVMDVMSILPGAMRAAMEVNSSMLYGALPVTRVQEEAIATVVSVANRCRY